MSNTDFTIISNNCWGGDVYRYFGLPYLSPIAGLYFWPDDYIKLCQNVRHYFESPVSFISFNESKHKDELMAKNQQNKIIGKLDDIEIVFLHYKSEEEAKEKWERRLQRVNYDNLIYKFSRQNGCTDEHILAFDKLPFSKKVVFDNKTNLLSCESVIHICGFEKCEQLNDDITSYRKFMDLASFLNTGKLIKKKHHSKE